MTISAEELIRMLAPSARAEHTESSDPHARNWCFVCHEWCYPGDDLTTRCRCCALREWMLENDGPQPIAADYAESAE